MENTREVDNTKMENAFDGIDLGFLIPEEVTEEVDTNIENTSDEEVSEAEVSRETTEDTASSDEDINDDAAGSEETVDETDEDNSSPSYTPYAKFLQEEGILPNLDLEKFEDSPQGLAQAMQEEINRTVEGWRSLLPPEIHSLIENYQEGVPLNTLLQIESQKTEYSSITDDSLNSSEDLQKRILRDYYKQATRFSDERIEKELNNLSDLGNLETESKEALQELIKLQDEYKQEEIKQAQLQRQEFEKAQQETLNTVKTTLKNTTEILPGLKLNDASRDEVFKIMTNPVAQDENGNLLNAVSKYRAENPIQFDIMLGEMYRATKGFKDWSALGKASKSQAIKELERSIQKQDINKGSGKGLNKNPSQEDLYDAISNF